MPWRECSVMEERLRFVANACSRQQRMRFLAIERNDYRVLTCASALLRVADVGLTCGDVAQGPAPDLFSTAASITPDDLSSKGSLDAVPFLACCRARLCSYAADLLVI
jgi:hypothetical protein